MKFTVFEHGLKNAAWSLWCPRPFHSSLALPLSFPAPARLALSVASMHSHCLRHSCPTLGLSDPPQYPYKFCLNVTFPRDYPSPSPFRSHHHHHPSPPGPLTVVLSPSTFQLSFLSPRSGLKSYLHVHLFMSLYTWAVQFQQPPKAVKHLKHTLSEL